MILVIPERVASLPASTSREDERRVADKLSLLAPVNTRAWTTQSESPSRATAKRRRFEFTTPTGPSKSATRRFGSLSTTSASEPTPTPPTRPARRPRKPTRRPIRVDSSPSTTCPRGERFGSRPLTDSAEPRGYSNAAATKCTRGETPARINHTSDSTPDSALVRPTTTSSVTNTGRGSSAATGSVREGRAAGSRSTPSRSSVETATCISPTTDSTRAVASNRRGGDSCASPCRSPTGARYPASPLRTRK